MAWSGAGAWGGGPPHNLHSQWASPYHGGHPVLGAGGGSNTGWQTVWGPQVPPALAFSPYRGPFPPPPLPPQAAPPPQAQEQAEAARGAQGQAHALESHAAGVQGHGGERQGQQESTEEQRTQDVQPVPLQQSTQPVQPMTTSPRPSAPRAEEAGQQGRLSSEPREPPAQARAPGAVTERYAQLGSEDYEAPSFQGPTTLAATFAAPSTGATPKPGTPAATRSIGVETSQGASGGTGERGPGKPQEAGEMPEGAPSSMELRLAHAKWNVRAYAYQELACAIYKLATAARQTLAARSPGQDPDALSQWATFLPLVSQALVETNVVALDRALNAAQQFLEHAPLDMCQELAASSAQVPAPGALLPPCCPMRSCRGSGVERRGMRN